MRPKIPAVVLAAALLAACTPQKEKEAPDSAAWNAMNTTSRQLLCLNGADGFSRATRDMTGDERKAFLAVAVPWCDTYLEERGASPKEPGTPLWTKVPPHLKQN